MAYIRAKGPIPDGFQIDHLCKVRNCINPDHLEAVTVTENIRRGSATKLTPELVIEIRQSTETGAAIARRLGVSRSLVSQIRARRLWRDIAPEQIGQVP